MFFHDPAFMSPAQHRLRHVFAFFEWFSAAFATKMKLQSLSCPFYRPPPYRRISMRRPSVRSQTAPR